MTFSIAMATFNGARYLREQLASIALQTSRPAELVACDDGSGDETLEILRAFGESAPFEVRVEVNPQRLGASDNFLKAASLCRSDWIAFCDQDDVWLPGKLAAVGALVRRRSGLVLVAHRASLVDETLRPSGRILHVPTVRRLRVVPPLAQSFWAYPYGFTMSFSARLLRAAPIAGRPVESHDRWIAIVASVLGETAYLPEVLALYRRHGQNASQLHPPLTPLGTLKQQGVEKEFSAASRLLEQLAAHLGQSAATASGEEATRLAEGARVYARHAAALSQRSELSRVGAPLGRRLRGYARLIASGGYRTHENGGLGWRACMKDALRIALSPVRGSS